MGAAAAAAADGAAAAAGDGAAADGADGAAAEGGGAGAGAEAAGWSPAGGPVAASPALLLASPASSPSPAAAAAATGDGRSCDDSSRGRATTPAPRMRGPHRAAVGAATAAEARRRRPPQPRAVIACAGARLYADAAERGRCHAAPKVVVFCVRCKGFRLRKQRTGHSTAAADRGRRLKGGVARIAGGATGGGGDDGDQMLIFDPASVARYALCLDGSTAVMIYYRFGSASSSSAASNELAPGRCSGSIIRMSRPRGVSKCVQKAVSYFSQIFIQLFDRALQVSHH